MSDDGELFAAFREERRRQKIKETALRAVFSMAEAAEHVAAGRFEAAARSFSAFDDALREHQQARAEVCE